MQHELLKFIAVVENKSFSVAASSLKMSQPALSVALKELEKQLGVKLIQQKGRRFQLTEAGQMVYATARRMRLELNNLQLLLKQSKSGGLNQLRVGMIDSLGKLTLSDKSIRMGVRLDIVVDNSKRLIDAVLTDKLDFAFITKPVKKLGGELKFEPMGSEPFVLVGLPGQIKNLSKKLKSDKLIPKFITYNQQSTTFKKIDEFLTESGYVYQPEFFSTSQELQRDMVLSGQGFSLLPYSIVRDDLSSKMLANVKGINFSRELAVIYQKGKYMSKPMLDLIEFTRVKLGDIVFNYRQKKIEG
jgi:DNA-binding transcriptional LysR family regulator